MSNASHISELEKAVSFLAHGHRPEEGFLSHTCEACHEPFPCRSARVAAATRSLGTHHFVSETATRVGVPANVSFALRHLDHWLTRLEKGSTDVSSCIDALHRLVISEDMECLAIVSTTGLLEFQVRLVGPDQLAIPLWAIVNYGDEYSLRMHIGQPTNAGRTFLTDLISDSYSITDAHALLTWWQQLDGGSSRTVTTPLPTNASDVCGALTSVISATYAAAEFHFTSYERISYE